MQIRLAPLPTLVLFSLFSLVQGANFTFSYGVPSECDDFSVTWSGGTAPYQLVLAPAFGNPRMFDIPSGAYSGGKGSYQTQLPFKKGRQFIATISDSSGFGAGGFSPILTVAQSSGSSSCNTTDRGVDFFFSLNSALTQCRTYTFSDYDRAIQPVTIYGIVPGGTSIQLKPPTGPTSYDWTADVAAGTYMMFIMSDSQGRQGGASDFRTVGISDDKTCLSANSPVSTTSTASSTSTGTSTSQSASSTSSSSASANPTPAPQKSNTGVIVGGVLAGLFGIAAIAMLGIFCFRRYRAGRARDHRLNSIDLDSPSVGVSPAPIVHPYPFSAPPSQIGAGSIAHGISPSEHNLLGGSSGYDTQSYTASSYPHTQSAYSGYTGFTHRQQPSVVESGIMEESTIGSGSGEDSMSGYGGGFAPSSISGFGGAVPASSSSSSSARRKAAMAGVQNYKTPTRFIVHTDLEETGPDEEAEVIELPPQYSERRAPLSVLNAAPAASAAPTSPPQATATAQTPAHYDTPPPFSPPQQHPLEADQGQSSARLQQPIEPGPPSPASTRLTYQ